MSGRNTGTGCRDRRGVSDWQQFWNLGRGRKVLQDRLAWKNKWTQVERPITGWTKIRKETARYSLIGDGCKVLAQSLEAPINHPVEVDVSNYIENPRLSPRLVE
jgi:hypothetical protein